MRNHFRKSGVFLAVAAAATMLPAGALSAQHSSLEEIVVTARKKEENLQDIPASITALSEQMIEKSFFQDIRDVQNVTPNLIFDEVSAGSANNAAITLRGIGFQDVEKSFDPAVGVMIDGMFLGSPNGAIFKTLDVEQIEVLRGPQGTLFGKNTIGGLIHVKRAQPSGELGARVRLGAGRFGRVAADAVFNAPEFSNIAIKGVLGYEKRDGYFKNIFDGSEVGEKDVLNYGIHIRFEPSDRFYADYRYDRSDDDSDTVPVVNNSSPASASGGLGVAGTGRNNADSAFGGRFSVNANTNYGDAFFTMDTHILTLEYRLSEGLSVKYIGGVVDTDEDILNNFAGFTIDAIALAGPGGDDQFYTARRIQDYEQSSHEFQVLGDVGDKLSFVAGAYLWNAEYTMTQDTYSFLFGPTPGLDAPDQTQLASHETDSWSLFAEVNADVTDRLELSAGLRHIEEEKELCSGFRLPAAGVVLFDTCKPSATDLPVSAPTGALTGDAARAYLAGLNPSAEWDDTIYKLSARYALNEEINLWAAFSTGFKSGGFNGRGGTLNSALRPYDPETVDSFEVGFKSRLFERRVQLNATYFHTDYSDLQVDANRAVDLGTGQETFVTNAASATIQGVELDGIWSIGDRLTVMGSLGWLDAEYEDFSADIGLGFADNADLKMRRAPELSFNLNGVYAWTIGEGEASVRVNYSWKDDYETLLTNNVFSRIDSYGLLDASIDYDWGRYRVSVFGRNLSDEDYFTHVFAVPVSEVLWNFGTPREPRVWGMQLSVDF